MSADEKPAGEMLSAEQALGTLGPRERAAFEASARSRPDLAERAAEWEARLAPLATQDPVEPSEGLWAKIEAGIDALPQQGALLVRAGERRWSDFLPGIQIQPLRENEDGTQSFLLRFEPGARLPAHDHPHTEECYILEGDMVVDSTVLRPGDYVAYPAGLGHHAVTTQNGAVVLLRGTYR